MLKSTRVVILGSFVSAILACSALAAQQSTPAAPQQPAAQTGDMPQAQTPAPTTAAPASSPSQPAASDGSSAPSANSTSSAPANAPASPASGSPSQPQASPSQAPPPPPPAATPAQSSQPPADQPADAQQQPKPKPGSWQDVDSIGNRNVGKGLDMYSLETEIAMGKEAAQEIERTSKLVDDPIVVEYVNRVGQNLVRNSDAKVPFTIKVIDSDEINAFALPGGFFYVNSGLILAADTEAELAGVMGHEIAHVCARHATKNATKMEIMQLATIPLILLGPGGWAGYGIYEGANLAIPISYLKFSRDDERQADYLGLQYMYKAGYDPNAFVSFFEKIEAEEKRNPGTIPKLFSDHPPTPDRMEAAQREIATILPPRDQYIVTTSEFDMVKARLRRIENKQKVQDTKPDHPTLRTRTERQGDPQGQAQPGTGTQSSGGDSTASSTSTDDPDRPVLKKRTDAPDNSSTTGGTTNGGTNNGGTNNGTAGGSSNPSSTPSATPSSAPSTSGTPSNGGSDTNPAPTLNGPSAPSNGGSGSGSTPAPSSSGTPNNGGTGN